MTIKTYPELDAFRRDLSKAFLARLRRGENPLAPHARVIPRNYVTGEAYHGAAALALILSGYDDPRWISADQATERSWERRDEEQPTVIEVRSPTQPTRLVDVYNVTQFHQPPDRVPIEAFSYAHKYHKASVIIRNSGAHFSHARDEASFYCPLRDTIYLGLRDDYSSTGDYYATALVHLNHWTGHPDRLDRTFGTSADRDRVQESLLAHLSSQRLADDLLLPQAAAGQEMLAEWIDVLEADSMLLASLAFEADGVTSFLLSLDPEDRANSIDDVSQSLDAIAIVQRIAYTEKADEDLRADISLYSKNHPEKHDPLSEVIHRAARNEESWSQTREEARNALNGIHQSRVNDRDNDRSVQQERESEASPRRDLDRDRPAVDQHVIIRGNSGKDAELTGDNAVFTPTVTATVAASPTKVQAVEQVALAHVAGPPGSSHFLNDIVLSVPDDEEKQKLERKKERTPPQRTRQDHSLER